jgi:hypothetical protein
MVTKRPNYHLLFTIHTKKEKTWIICVENKVDSTEGRDQLKRYHEIIERRFAAAERRIYVFLTKHHEPPAHPEYIESSYEDVVKTLRQCLAEREDSIGTEPKFLIRQYLQLLEEDFMDENESSRLARQIYLRHKSALDYIFENKVDPIFEATNALEAALGQNADELGIVMDRTIKRYVRFVPKAWDMSNNNGGTAWGPNSRFLLCEVVFWTEKVELHITAGRTPEDWANRLWKRADHEPFRQEWKKQPTAFIKPFKAKSDIAVDPLGELDDEEAGARVLDWVRQELAKDKFKKAVDILTDLLKELPAA